MHALYDACHGLPILLPHPADVTLTPGGSDVSEMLATPEGRQRIAEAAHRLFWRLYHQAPIFLQKETSVLETYTGIQAKLGVLSSDKLMDVIHTHRADFSHLVNMHLFYLALQQQDIGHAMHAFRLLEHRPQFGPYLHDAIMAYRKDKGNPICGPGRRRSVLPDPSWLPLMPPSQVEGWMARRLHYLLTTRVGHTRLYQAGLDQFYKDLRQLPPSSQLRVLSASIQAYIDTGEETMAYTWTRRCLQVGGPAFLGQELDSVVANVVRLLIQKEKRLKAYALYQWAELQLPELEAAILQPPDPPAALTPFQPTRYVSLPRLISKLIKWKQTFHPLVPFPRRAIQNYYALDPTPETARYLFFRFLDQVITDDVRPHRPDLSLVDVYLSPEKPSAQKKKDTLRPWHDPWSLQGQWPGFPRLHHSMLKEHVLADVVLVAVLRSPALHRAEMILDFVHVMDRKMLYLPQSIFTQLLRALVMGGEKRDATACYQIIKIRLQQTLNRLIELHHLAKHFRSRTDPLAGSLSRDDVIDAQRAHFVALYRPDLSLCREVLAFLRQHELNRLDELESYMTKIWQME